MHEFLAGVATAVAFVVTAAAVVIDDVVVVAVVAIEGVNDDNAVAQVEETLFVVKGRK